MAISIFRGIYEDQNQPAIVMDIAAGASARLDEWEKWIDFGARPGNRNAAVLDNKNQRKRFGPGVEVRRRERAPRKIARC